MKFLREIWAELRRQEAAKQQARSEAYDKAPGHHWAFLGLAYALCIGAVFVTIWLAK